MENINRKPFATATLFTLTGKEPDWADFDAVLLAVEPKVALADALKGLPRPSSQEILAFAKRSEFKARPKQTLAFDSATQRKIVVAIVPTAKATFTSLEWARKVIKPLLENKSSKILVDLRATSRSNTLLDAIVSARIGAEFEPYKYSKKKKEKQNTKPPVTFCFCLREDELEPLSHVLEKAILTAEGTNLVRQLAHLAGNDLTPSRYVESATEIAKGHSLKTEFFSLEKLRKMGAGAFLAVAQGSQDRGGGILKITYQPRQFKKTLALVGKGITFDTGGTNIKTGAHMFNMHYDMSGSAVALATLLVAKRSQWPLKVETYLAISDNSIGPESYRPNDVVTSLKGLTIEVIDADAEGRMVLADALYLSSLSKPDLVIDFATLTGACIRAIGHLYSGGFSNRSRLLRSIEKAGKKSGERVWPFPKDPDFARCLKSQVADIKQCRISGGTDHIEASQFLSKFVEKGVPWVHVDTFGHPK